MAASGINSLHAELPQENMKIYLYFFIISYDWNNAGNLNHSWWKTNIHLTNIINTMAADDLATQVARASAAMELT